MNVKKDDVFKLSSGVYITLDETEYDGVRYIFVNKLDEREEPTKEFVVFKCLENGLVIEKNKNVLTPVLNYFSERANDNLELISDLYKRGEKNDDRQS